MQTNGLLKKFGPSMVRRIYPSVVLVTVLVILVIGHGYFTSTRITSLYAPHIDAAMEIKLEVTTGHLWLEEILSGDRNPVLQDVFSHYKQADWYAKAMLEGGQNQAGVFAPLRDPVLRRDIAETDRQLGRFIEITRERLATHLANRPGSEIDQQYDRAFDTLLGQADRVEGLLQNKVQSELLRFKAVQLFLVVFSVLFAGVSFLFLRKIEVREERSRQAIQTMNTQLQQEIVERLETEKALHRSQELYSLAQKVARVGSWEFNMKTGKLVWSAEVEPMFGLKPGEFAGTYDAFLQTVHPEDRELVAELVEIACEKEVPYEVEHRIVWPDQSERWVQEIGLALRNGDDGKPTRMVGMVHDVTTQKLARDERERLIAELQEALDKVKVLSGFLPICASCKRIRDDKGYWNQIESYIRDHSEAEFSHGICPDCAEKLYPFLDLNKKKGEKQP